MSFFKFFVFILALQFLALPGRAQEGDRPDDRRMKTMIDYREELGLSEAQVKEIQAAFLNYQSTAKSRRDELATGERDYRKLVEEEAPLSEIKSKLRTITDLRFQLRYLDVLTSRKVQTTLSDDQMAKWRSIQGERRGGRGSSGSRN